jgi:Lon protease-like protein
LPAKGRGPTRVSFQIAAALSFDLSLKQKLLEMRDERARLQLLVSSMSRWLPLIERARKSAGGNGRYR